MGLRLLFVCWLCLCVTHSAIIKGFIKNSPGFEFVGKFCFDFTGQDIPHAGFLEAHVTTAPGEDPVKNGLNKLSVLFFDDETTSWETILNTNKACKDKLGLAKGHFDVDLKGEKMYHGSSWIAQHIRPRFWYVVLANCEGFTNVEYAVHFVNVNRGVTNREFGTNDQGINWIYLTFGCVFTFFVLKHLTGLSGHVDDSPENSRGTNKKKKHKLDDNGDVNDNIDELSDGETEGLLSGNSSGTAGITNARQLCCSCLNTGLHPIFKLFTAALVWAYVGIVAMTVHTWAFAFGGIGYPTLIFFEQCCLVISRMCFLCLLMLLAKGWTISSNTLTGANAILAVVAGFGLINFLTVAWESSLDLRSPLSEVPFLLRMVMHAETVAWVGFGVWFAHTMRASYQDEYKPAKQSLYTQLGVIYIPWIISTPVILVLSELLNPWVRAKIVAGCSLSFMFFGYAVMAYLLWPSRASEYFDVSVPDVQKSKIDSYDEL